MADSQSNLKLHRSDVVTQCVRYVLALKSYRKAHTESLGTYHNPDFTVEQQAARNKSIHDAHHKLVTVETLMFAAVREYLGLRKVIKAEKEVAGAQEA